MSIVSNKNRLSCEFRRDCLPAMLCESGQHSGSFEVIIGSRYTARRQANLDIWSRHVDDQCPSVGWIRLAKSSGSDFFTLAPWAEYLPQSFHGALSGHAADDRKCGVI